METLEKKRKYTYAEYLQMELDTDVRHEFWNGEVFAMAGTSKGHNDIAGNIYILLRNKYKPLGCSVHSESVKLELEKENYYVYPDLLLSCDNADKTDDYLIRNPSLIVEVLSPSTESYDRRVKLAQYRKIKSLKYCLLVSQSSPFVEIFGRTNQSDLFTYDSAAGLDPIIQLPLLDFALPMSKVYEYIEFGEEG